MPLDQTTQDNYKKEILDALDKGQIGESVGQVIGVVVAITLAIIFPPSAGWTFAWLAGWAAVGAAIGGLIDPPRIPKIDFGNDTGSPRYGFGALANTFTNEIPIPVLYGELKLAGNVFYQSEPGATVHRGVGVSEGEIESISSVKINDVDIAELTGCSHTAHLGTSTQDVDSRFSSDVYGLRYFAYLALTMETSDKLKGGNPTTTYIAEGRKVNTWNGSSWSATETYSRNPAACLRDFLISTRYGAGIPVASIDATTWGEAYDYLAEQVANVQGTGTEVRAYLDYIIDSRRPVLDVVKDILSTFSGYLVFSGSKIKLKIEKAESVSQAFTMANIVRGSFSYSKESKDNLPNRVKVQYIDPTYNYTKIFAQADDVIDQAQRRSLALGEDIETLEVSMLGITRYSQAARQAKIILYLAKVCGTYCTFTVGPDALACEVGNIISVSHDVPSWTAKEFRLLGIKATKDDKIQLICREYNSSIYSGYQSSIVVPDYGTPINPWKVPTDPTGVTATEIGYEDKDGKWVCGCTVSFTASSDSQIIHHYIIQKSKDGGTYADCGVSDGVTYDVYPLQVDHAYTFKVKTVSIEDRVSSGAVSSSLTLEGNTEAPETVTGFDIYQQGDTLRFTWTAVGDEDLARYIIKKGSTWSTATTIAELIDITEFQYPVSIIGKETYQIKAQDFSGNTSVAPTLDTIVVTRPPEMNFTNSYDIFAENLDYFQSDVDIVYRNDYNSGYSRPTIALDTGITWEEREAEGQTWEYQETNNGLLLNRNFLSTGYFEMKTPIDLEAIFEFKIIADIDYANVSGGSVTIYMSYSEDNSSWSSFAEVLANTLYRARYLKFRFVLATTNTDHNVYFYGAVIYITAPVVQRDYGRDVAILAEGKSILFGVDYDFAPRVQVTIVNGVCGFIKVSSKTKDGFDLRIFEDQAQGTAIGTAECDWDSSGY